jgi:hypothetical protein
MFGLQDPRLGTALSTRCRPATRRARKVENLLFISEIKFFFSTQRIFLNALTSVADPDPALSDPYVFGPPGQDPDPIVKGMDPDPDPSIIKQKLYE